MIKTILKPKILGIIAVTFFAGILIGGTGIDNNEASAQEGTVPDWVKNNAGWWSSEEISTGEYVTGLEWLINEGIINVPGATAQGVDPSSIVDLWSAVNNLQRK